LVLSLSYKDTTGYITPGPLPRVYSRIRIELTKKGLERILNGYPPWYSEYLILANGGSIPHPIKSMDDVARGGWIVAVGLSSTCPTQQECLKHGLPSEMFDPPALSSAFNRISHGLRNTPKVYPTNPMVEAALELVDAIRRNDNTTSRLTVDIRYSKLTEVFSRDVRGLWVADEVKDYATGLSNEQCMIAIEVFNRYEDQLSEEVVVALNPILLVVSRAVVVGCYQVMKYFDRRRDPFDDLQLTKGSERA
jgi:hypothetical protein